MSSFVNRYLDTLTEEDLRKKDDTSTEPKKLKSKRNRVPSDESDDTVKKDKSKRLRVVSDDDSDDDEIKKNKSKRLRIGSGDDSDDNEIKKNKSKRMHIGSGDSDEVVKKKVKSKRLRVVSDDSDEVVKKKVKSKRLGVVSDDDSDAVKVNTPKKSVVVSDKSDDDVVAGSESPDDLMVVDVRLGRGRGRADDASGGNVDDVENDSTNQAARMDDGNQKTDKETRKSKRKEIPPAIVNDDGICFSNNGQYCLDMSQRYELSELAVEWTRTLCNQNKVRGFFSLK